VRVGVITSDFRVYYRLVNILKGMRINFTSLISTDGISDYDIVFSDMELNFSNCYRTNGKNEYWIRQMLLSGHAKELIIGIDPGPNPGVATISDGQVLDSRNLYELNDVLKYVDSVTQQCDYDRLRIKIGNGDRANREKIITTLKNYDLEIIREDGSSKSLKRGRDWEAAIKIATSSDIIERRNRKIKR